MTTTVGDIIAVVALCTGLFFVFVGAVGVIRLPDPYHRMHAASKCTTLGLAGLLIAAVCHLGTLELLTKAVITLVFAFAATPVGSHILAKASLRDRAPQWRGTLEDDFAEDHEEA